MVVAALRSRELSRTRLLGVAAVLAVTVAVAAYGDPGWPTLVVSVTAVGYLGAGAFRRVRDHDLYHVVYGLVVTVWGAAMYVGGTQPRALTLIFLIGGPATAAVELYNYRHGTTYGRIA